MPRSCGLVFPRGRIGGKESPAGYKATRPLFVMRLDVRKLYGSKCLACASDQELVCGVDDGDISAVHPTDRIQGATRNAKLVTGMRRMRPPRWNVATAR